MADEHLLLKWGTLKGWAIENEETFALLREYNELGQCMSVALQRDTPEQKALLCQIIDRIDGPIQNDWSGEEMTKDEAKQYVMEYGKSKVTP